MKVLALAALALFTISATPAVQAQVLLDTNCTAKCDEPNDPGKPGSAESTAKCSEQLGYMKRVYREEVAGVDDNTRVWVTEICTGDELMRADGNAAYLRTTIAQNDILAEALGRRDYTANDVISVRMMGDDTINLYVHRFTR